ncbi:hypothetical protein P154DRAFT_304648 [Amniculicola lignicola CBS 123094]|uniref:F-box domain-containing protein n=1 Tax=Amniculicola lignicola CBS 123094 TaxID=1392246 RepID=A0A6A5WCI3_9PLEO|nr:hypothetical protein P154DRAFT_304648 [Amniculicola lignicola CBS 123094]
MFPTRSRLTDLSFPTELILEIVQHLPFDANTISTLASVHPRIKAVLYAHNISITKHFARRQLPHVFIDFPRDNSIVNYAWLAQCIHQYDTTDHIMATLTSELNHFAVESHNMALANAGLLLLYRISSIESYPARLTFLKNLSRDPLIAVWFVVHFSTLTARYYAKRVINQQTYAKGQRLNAAQVQFREDIEFAFAEGALNLGPDFIADVFYQEDGAEPTLMCFYHQHTNRPVGPVDQDIDFQRPVTQGPLQEPGSKPRSLYTTLLECLSQLYKSSLEDVAMGVIEVDTKFDDHHLAGLTLSGKARLLQGLDMNSESL